MQTEAPVRYSEIVKQKLRENEAIRIENERRRNIRVPTDLDGRCLIGRRDEARCKVLNVSMGGMEIASSLDPEKGQQIVCYIDGLGRVAGDVVRRTERGFAISFTPGPIVQERIERLIGRHLTQDVANEAEVTADGLPDSYSQDEDLSPRMM